MLPCRSGLAIFRGRAPEFRSVARLQLSGLSPAAAKRRKATPTPNASKEDFGLKNIPLTVGHEAKGLVLPNYDLKGHLLGRFEAATASPHR